MKVTWEAEDIVPGRRYGREKMLERWFIGYLSNVDGVKRYVSISEIDGMVTAPKTKEEWAISLTEANYLPVELLGRP